MGIYNFKGARKYNLTVFTEVKSVIMVGSPDYLPPKYIFFMTTIIVFPFYYVLKAITNFEHKFAPRKFFYHSDAKTNIKGKQIQKSTPLGTSIFLCSLPLLARASAQAPTGQLLVILTPSEGAFGEQISTPILFSFGSDHSRMCRPSRVLGWGQSAFSVLKVEVK